MGEQIVQLMDGICLNCGHILGCAAQSIAWLANGSPGVIALCLVEVATKRGVVQYWSMVITVVSFAHT